MLEIAPGFGRWTSYLKDLAERLVIVDLSEHCIEHCRQRFRDANHIEYHVNDGRSLEMVEDSSIDLVFSFDSLVHADPGVLDAYVGQLARKLKPEGIGFIHHSNFGSHPVARRVSRAVPNRLRAPLVRRGALVDIYAWRDPHMTGRRFSNQCEAAGLAVLSQELISWEHGRYLTDALSLFAHPGAARRPPRRVSNRSFNREAARMAALYANPRDD